MRCSSVIAARKSVKNYETRSIDVDREDRALVRVAADKRRPIQGVARQNQTRYRVSPIASASESMQHAKTRAIDIDGKHRAEIVASEAAGLRRPEQRVARQN